MPPNIVFLIPILGIVGGCAVIITAMNLISQHLSGRRRELPEDSMQEVLRRLDRIEQIVDTTGVEVERLAEANRFMSKLLSERSTRPL
jgi:hypothetical protein